MATPWLRSGTNASPKHVAWLQPGMETGTQHKRKNNTMTIKNNALPTLRPRPVLARREAGFEPPRLEQHEHHTDRQVPRTVYVLPQTACGLAGEATQLQIQQRLPICCELVDSPALSHGLVDIKPA